MAGNSYIVIALEKDGRKAAEGKTIGNNLNLKAYIDSIELSGFKVLSINTTHRLKEAREIADQWNKIYKEKGVYLYD